MQDNKGTQALLHTVSFTQRTFTQRNFYTKKNWHRKTHTDHAKKQLHTETFARKNITQSNFFTFFSAQKLFRTETFTHKSLYAQQFLHKRFYTQMPLHRKIGTHRSLCTQHAFTHSQLLHREALLPLRDHLPFVFPLSSCICIYRNWSIAIYGRMVYVKTRDFHSLHLVHLSDVHRWRVAFYSSNWNPSIHWR